MLFVLNNFFYQKELRDCQDELSHCNAKLTGDEKKFKENLTWTESQVKYMNMLP